MMFLQRLPYEGLQSLTELDGTFQGHRFPNRYMASEQSSVRLESVHMCPKCGHSLNLEKIDLKAITTGIVECPNCGLSGPIEIKIVDENQQSL